MQTLLKKLIAILLLVLLGFLPLSCNTMQGMGEDMESAGEAIQEKAQ